MADPNNHRAGGTIVSHYADLALCLLAVALSAWAYASLPDRDPLRILLVAPMLLFVPGYLLIEAFRAVRDRLEKRVIVAAVAPGVSLAFVALLALMTAWLPSGFTPNAIVAMVSLASVGLLATASYRRARIWMLTHETLHQPEAPHVPQTPQVAPRPSMPQPAPSPAPRPSVPMPSSAKPFQPVRPGTPVPLSPRQMPSAPRTPRTQPATNNVGADLRDGQKVPPRTYKIVQTGRL